MKKDNSGIVAFLVIGFVVLIYLCPYFLEKPLKGIVDNINKPKSNYLNILSSSDNKDLEPKLKEYAKKNKIELSFQYMGDIEIVEELNSNSKNYDAVWVGNSLWLYMLDNSYLTSNSKSISISPVVMGIRKSKALELGLIGKDISNTDILNLVKNNQIKYVMSSVTSTNDGASAYLGFLNSLAGSPEVLKEEMLDNEKLLEDVRNLFKGVERVSGDQNFLETMFINSNNYEAVIASESSLININKQLKAMGRESLYLIYPFDGVPINDSTFAYIDNGLNREEAFLTIQKYLLSDEGQDELKKLGRRTWYGGVTNKVDKTVFNKDWGIDTTKYLVATKYPSRTVINKALNLYVEELRKPGHTVFCLDYSGSMYGTGESQLTEAMEYILTYDNASKDRLQFSRHDNITVIPFSSKNLAEWKTTNGKETTDMLNKIKALEPTGGTNLYQCVERAVDILNNTSSDYTKTVIAMTDGQINYSSFNELKTYYNNTHSDVPVYSIMFGQAVPSELSEIAKLTNAKVFDGRTNLLRAFKEVRGYN